MATRNSDKLRELQAVFATSQLDLAQYDGYGVVEENGENYADNARLKADALFEQLHQAGIVDCAVIADDSGLEVAALGGRPGVLSARYGGANLPWPRRRKRLLYELRTVTEENRGAKFCCSMHFITPAGKAFISYGEVTGKIAIGESGAFGFGYDAVFIYPPRAVSFAELSEEEKNAISHRRRAANSLLADLKGLAFD
ncbi:MAG: non-canonical purine NTP pyrophosphatase [Candidatus Eremiobacteraeota bacterium]|nr:non-canonical purine NTP pyrophosphatase [Candidatus Eremiobacteraeota bacterium]